jgi:hypothetical protein
MLAMPSASIGVVSTWSSFAWGLAVKMGHESDDDNSASTTERLTTTRWRNLPPDGMAVDCVIIGERYNRR